MTLFEMAQQVENQGIQIDYARSTLQAVTEEIEGYERKHRYIRKEHALLLLNLTNVLLFDASSELGVLVQIIIEKHKEQKAERVV